MPVMDQLFAARADHRWEVAEKAAARVNDEADPAGDLADELGDTANAKRRAMLFKASVVEEPRSFYHLKKNQVAVEFVWDKQLSQGVSERMKEALQGRTWLFHESVWLSRHLDRSASVVEWIARAREAGLEIRRPFAQGRDCIDCGGEGAYGLLFPEQAKKMAQEYWERDQHRAQGILCLSRRCAEHMRNSLKNFDENIRVQSLAELLEGK
jgi:hypothetical protein